MDAFVFAQQALNGANGFFCLIWPFLALLGLTAFAVWVWALADAIRNPTLDSTMRLVWVIVIVFTHIIGAILYFAIGRNESPGGPR